MKNILIKGKLPERILKHPVIRAYVKEMLAQPYPQLWGYLGHENRTDQTDRFIVKTLKAAGFDARQIAIFMISRAGRHTMDTFNVRSESRRKRDLINGMRWALDETDVKAGSD